MIPCPKRFYTARPQFKLFLYCLKYSIIGLILLSTPAFGQTSTIKTFDKEMLLADALLMINTFEEVQVNSYLHISKSELQRKKDSIFNAIPLRVDEKKAFVVLSQIAALVKDAHTYVDNYAAIVESFQKSRVFPLGIHYKANYKSLKVLNKFSETSSVKLGATLISINGYNARQLFQKAASLQGGLDAYRFNEAKNNFSYHLYLLGIHAPFKITYKEEGKAIQKETLDGISYQDYLVANQVTPIANFSFKLLPNHIGYINFNAMSGMKKFKTFLDSTFTALKMNQAKGLIVDLRYNGGGNSDLAELLLSYLTAKPYRLSSGRNFKVSVKYQMFMKENYPDQTTAQVITYLNAKPGTVLYFPYQAKNFMPNNPNRYLLKTAFLIGPQNLSSATMLADGAQTYKLATLIGQPTGAPANDGGESYNFRLPNTGFEVYTSSTFDIRANCRKKDATAILPDISVVEDKSDSKDAILDYGIRWILK
ncbi:hypothetical protein HQN83_16740 [Pedobacter sp. LMG 31643]|nr:hypothetical protein [Pedobacter foliorum]